MPDLDKPAHQAAPDTRRVAAAVAEAVGAQVRRVEPVAGSVENADFLALTDAVDVVVKVGATCGLAAEVWACEQARSIGVPAPEVIAAELDEPTLLPHPYIILRRLPGQALSRSGPDENVARDVGRWLRRTHTIHAGGFGHLRMATLGHGHQRGPHSTWADFTAEPLQHLPEMTGQNVVDQSLACRIRSALVEHADALAYDGPGVLLHGDLKAGHIFASCGRLTGIIDWGDVLAGDPLFDLAPLVTSDPAMLPGLLSGYGIDLTQAATRMCLYRIVRTTLVLYHEYRAGGDWFAAYRERIAADLNVLG